VRNCYLNDRPFANALLQTSIDYRFKEVIEDLFLKEISEEGNVITIYKMRSPVQLEEEFGKFIELKHGYCAV
jgi:hypothetical protein